MRRVKHSSVSKSGTERVSKTIKKPNNKCVLLVQESLLKSGSRAPSVKRVHSRKLSRVIPKLDLTNLSSTNEGECLSARSPETVKGVQTYKSLREQLHKITQELRAERHDIDDISTMQKQRRTREERRKRNFHLENTTPLPNKDIDSLIKEQLNNLKSANHKKDIQAPKEIGSGRRSVGMEKITLFNQNNNVTKQLTKENKRPSFKQLKILKSASNKRLTDPNKHIVRKYLAELYTKITLKVKDIERERRGMVLRKGLEKCATSKSNLNRTQALKTGLHQPKKSLQCDAINIIP
jgi:hypothetical protein